MEAAVDESTILLVGSAPSYPKGRRPDRGPRGRRPSPRPALPRGCLHGRLHAPFLARAGRFERLFDFRVEGVTSMSADLHSTATPPKGFGRPLPHTGARPAPGLRHHRLARRVLRLDRHGRHPAGRSHRRSLGIADAPRPRGLHRPGRAHPRRRAGIAPGHRGDRRPRRARRPVHDGAAFGRSIRAPRHLRGGERARNERLVSRPPERPRQPPRHRPAGNADPSTSWWPTSPSRCSRWDRVGRPTARPPTPPATEALRPGGCRQARTASIRSSPAARASRPARSSTP